MKSRCDIKRILASCPKHGVTELEKGWSLVPQKFCSGSKFKIFYTKDQPVFGPRPVPVGRRGHNATSQSYMGGAWT
jgi:hypothetical protein